MYAIISYHDSTYQPLADITWDNNKIPYSQKYGYYCEFEPLEGLGHIGQLQKVRFINRMLNDPRNFEWIWWTGCDLMVMNFHTRIEDKIDNNYHMVIATDCNGVNADSILIRNSELGRAYWKMVADILPTYSHHWEGEQRIIKDTYPNYKEIIKIVPQRDINAYDYNIYNGIYPNKDFLGTDGNWQPGDWAIQWPGIGFDVRMRLAHHYAQLVIK